MIIFLYGPDTYRSRQKLTDIIDYYKRIHKSGLNLKYFDGKDLNFQALSDELQSASIFKERKLIVLENSLLNKDFKKEFLKNSEKFINSKEIILFYENSQILENDSLFKFLRKHAKSQEFQLLGGQKLKSWVKKEFEKYRCQITDGALEKLIEWIGNDLWRLSNEIKKLASFKSDIQEKDVELLVKPKIETDIFKTIDFLASRNKKQALKFVRKHLEKGDSPLYLLSMINFQLRNLLLVKSQESGGRPYDNFPFALSKKLNLHPYIIKKTIQQADKFSFEELKKIYQKVFQADFNIKTGKIDPEIALDLLIAEI